MINVDKFSKYQKKFFDSNGTDMDALNNMILLNKNDPFSYFYKGVILFDNGDYNESLENFFLVDKILDKDAVNITKKICSNFGYSNNFTKALDNVINFKDDVSSYIDANHSKLGNYNDLKNFSFVDCSESEICDYLSYLKTLNSDDVNLKNMASCYFFLNDYDSAADYFEKSINLNCDSLDLYIKYIELLIVREDYKYAILLCDRALLLDNKNISILYFKGVCYSLLCDFDEGIKYFSIIIELDPCHSDAYCSRGCIYDELGKFCAKDDFLKAIELDSKNYKAYFHLGDFYLSSNDFETAVTYFKTAIFDHDFLIYSYYKIAFCYYNLSDYDNCLNYINKALDINSNDASFHSLKASVYFDLNKLNKAIDSFKTAYLLADNFSTCFSLFDCFIEKNDIENILLYSKKCLDYNVDNNMVYTSLSFYYFDMLDYDNAISIFEKFLDFSNEDTNYISYLYYGKSLIKTNQYLLAIKCFEFCFSSAEYCSIAKANYAFCLYKLGNSAKAFKILKNVLRKDKYNTDALLNISLMYFILDNYNLSLKYYKKVLHLVDDDLKFFVLFNISICEFKLGNYNVALDVFENLLENNMIFSSIYYYVGSIYRILGDNNKAKNFFELELENVSVFADECKTFLSDISV